MLTLLTWVSYVYTMVYRFVFIKGIEKISHSNSQITEIFKNAQTLNCFALSLCSNGNSNCSL